MLDQEILEQLLNRPLTTAEVSNLELYLEITTEKLSDLLCMNLSTATEERTYDVRSGYRTIFTDPFSGTPVVSANGEVLAVDKYSKRLFDNLNGTWFNSIVFKTFLPRDTTEISVTADFGFPSGVLPKDLQMLYATLFGTLEESSKTVSTERISSKQIEDYRVTYATDTLTTDTILLKNASVINKYSLCGVGGIRHGSVQRIW